MQQAGVLIDGVAAGTDAFDRGLVPGDVILRVQDTDVKSPQQVQRGVRRRTGAAQGRIVLVAGGAEEGNKIPGPRWMALRVADDGAAQQQP